MSFFTHLREPAIDPIAANRGPTVDRCSNSLVAWYSDTTPSTFTSTCSWMSARFTSLTKGHCLEMPALATTMSRWSMLCFVWSSETASVALCSLPAS